MLLCLCGTGDGVGRGVSLETVVSVSLPWGLCTCLSFTFLHQAGLDWAGSSCVCSEARLRAVLNTLQPP